MDEQGSGTGLSHDKQSASSMMSSKQKVIGVNPCYEYHISQAITISICIKNVYQILKLQCAISNFAITFEM